MGCPLGMDQQPPQLADFANWRCNCPRFSCFHARYARFCARFGYPESSESTDLSIHHHSVRQSSVFLYEFIAFTIKLPYGRAQMPLDVTPIWNFQGFHLCFRGTSNDWHAQFQSFVMTTVRCCLRVLDFKKRKEALKEYLVVWNL